MSLRLISAATQRLVRPSVFQTFRLNQGSILRARQSTAQNQTPDPKTTVKKQSSDSVSTVKNQSSDSDSTTKKCPGFEQHAPRSKPHDAEFIKKLKTDIVDAMKSKDSLRLAVLRNVLSTYNQKRDRHQSMSEVEIVDLLHGIKSELSEAANQAEEAGREDLSEKAHAELGFLERYMAESNLKFMPDAEVIKCLLPHYQEALRSGVKVERLSMFVMTRVKASGVFDGSNVSIKRVAKIVAARTERLREDFKKSESALKDTSWKKIEEAEAAVSRAREKLAEARAKLYPNGKIKYRLPKRVILSTASHQISTGRA